MVKKIIKSKIDFKNEIDKVDRKKLINFVNFWLKKEDKIRLDFQKKFNVKSNIVLSLDDIYGEVKSSINKRRNRSVEGYFNTTVVSKNVFTPKLREARILEKVDGVESLKLYVSILRAFVEVCSVNEYEYGDYWTTETFYGRARKCTDRIVFLWTRKFACEYIDIDRKEFFRFVLEVYKEQTTNKNYGSDSLDFIYEDDIFNLIRDKIDFLIVEDLITKLNINDAELDEKLKDRQKDFFDCENIEENNENNCESGEE